MAKRKVAPMPMPTPAPALRLDLFWVLWRGVVDWEPVAEAEGLLEEVAAEFVVEDALVLDALTEVLEKVGVCVPEGMYSSWFIVLANRVVGLGALKLA